MESDGRTAIERRKTMKKRMKQVVLLFSMVICSAVFFQQGTYASDTVGGQVTRSGNISFSESGSSTEQTTDSTTSSIKKEQIAKLKGIFPNTGEAIQKYGMAGLGIVFILFCFFFLRSIRKEKQE